MQALCTWFGRLGSSGTQKSAGDARRAIPAHRFGIISNLGHACHDQANLLRVVAIVIVYANLDDLIQFDTPFGAGDIGIAL